MRMYTGIIRPYDHTDAEYMQGVDLGTAHRFTQSGQWVAGSRVIGSYQLCDANGDPLEEFEHLQFSRSRRNEFYLEAVN